MLVCVNGNATAQRIEVLAQPSGVAALITPWNFPLGALRPDVPMAGHKSSGLGVEGGLPGLLSFTQAKVLHIMRPSMA